MVKKSKLPPEQSRNIFRLKREEQRYSKLKPDSKSRELMSEGRPRLSGVISISWTSATSGCDPQPGSDVSSTLVSKAAEADPEMKSCPDWFCRCCRVWYLVWDLVWWTGRETGDVLFLALALPRGLCPGLASEPGDVSELFSGCKDDWSS